MALTRCAILCYEVRCYSGSHSIRRLSLSSKCFQAQRPGSAHACHRARSKQRQGSRTVIFSGEVLWGQAEGVQSPVIDSCEPGKSQS